jgi:DNA phosphorothioation-associated putative methyltransferase
MAATRTDNLEIFLADLDDRIARERTALFRDRLSTPFQALLKHGFIDGSFTVFDYGCGRGDDLRLLEAGGIEARGWDPHYAPKEPITPADVVNSVLLSM